MEIGFKNWEKNCVKWGIKGGEIKKEFIIKGTKKEFKIKGTKKEFKLKE